VRGIVRTAAVAATLLVAITRSGAALARSSESVHNLRTVEAAFYRAKLPFSEDWTPHPPNPYLVPAQRSGPWQEVPKTLQVLAGLCLRRIDDGNLVRRRSARCL